MGFQYPLNATQVQLDIPLALPYYYTIPQTVPGRLNFDDFVHFNIPSSMDVKGYSVAVESNDTAGPRYRVIGPLAKDVQLPFVHFGSGAKILVLPNNDENKPRFISFVDRQATYTLPHATSPGLYQMEKSGVTILGVPGF